MSRFGLLIDLKNKQLRDDTTGLQTSVNSIESDANRIKVVEGNSVYHKQLLKYPTITRPEGITAAKKHSVVYHIKTTPGPSVSCKARPLAPNKLKIAQEEFRQLIKLGIARPSTSAWASPLHLVPKKSGEWRLCGDYRPINTRTVDNKYSIRRLADCAAALKGKKVFSVVDFARAYNQIPVAEEDIEKTAIITPFGLFEFLYMTFGLKNAGQTFQSFIDEVTRDLSFVFAYIDDLLIASDDEQ